MHGPNLITLFLVFLMTATLAAARSAHSHGSDNAASAAPDINTLIDRMEDAQVRNRAHYRAYTSTREYRLYGHDGQHPSSEVVAQINFVPPDQKTFAIERASGSSRGTKIVRNLLDGEAKRAPKYEQNALTRENYNFQYLGRATLDGRLCYLVKLNPKREQPDMVQGRAWVDAQTYLVRQVDGELAKSPSWWLKSVKVTLTFGEAEGMWLQTGTRALAEVRFFGTHTLESRTLDLRTAESVAQTKPTRRAVSVRPTRPAVAGEAVFVHP